MLALAAALVAAGIGIDRIELTYLGLVFAGVVALGAIVVRLAAVPRAVSRTLSAEIVAVGETLRIEAAIVGGAIEFIDHAVDGASDGLDLREIPASTDAAYRSEVTASRRGPQTVGPLRVELLAPLRVARRRVAVGGVDEVIAVPPVVALASVHARGREDGEEPTRHERIGQGTDNLVPRPYLPGDSMRRVHWRASAHHGDLMVREEERETTPTAAVILDLADDAWRADSDFERALSACVSVVARLRIDGFAVDVMAADGSMLGSVDSSEAFDDLLVTCARLDPHGQGEPTMKRADGAGLVVAIGRAPRPAATPATHILLAADPTSIGAETAGWHAAALDDVALSWARALDGGDR